MKTETVYRKALKVFGAKNQIQKTVEESTELNLALIYYLDGRTNLPNVITEIADVEIMIAQLKLALTETTNQNISELIANEKRLKIERLEKLLKHRKTRR